MTNHQAQQQTPPTPPVRGWKRYRLAARGDVAVSLALASLILVLVNMLAQHVVWRHAFSDNEQYRLSERTRMMLQDLSREIRITALMRPDHKLAGTVQDLLREYEYASPLLRVTRLDPHRDLSGIRALTMEHGIRESDIVVFESGGSLKVVNIEEIAEFDYLPVLYGRERRLKAFHGEEFFTSAIHAVSALNAPTAYYLRGYGERDINDSHPVSGHSDLARLIRNEQINLREFNIAKTGGMPEDADLVIVAGPRRRFAAAELAVLRRYLENQGRLLILLDVPATGLETILYDWGVTVGQGRVVGLTLTGAELFVKEYGEHPITTGLSDITSVFYRPLPLFINELAGPANQADRPRVFPLASGNKTVEVGKTGAKTSFEGITPAVAVAMEKGPVRGIDIQRRPTRMVVFSDVDFSSNTGMVAGNAILLANALNWLLQREGRTEVAPRLPKKDALLISRQNLTGLLLSATVAVPAVFLFLGFVVRRRRRTAD